MAHDVGSILDAMFIHGLDIRERRVFLHASMETAESNPDRITTAGPMENVIRALLYLDKTRGDIELWINSPGGLVVEMFGLYDVIRTLENPVHTVGFGHVCSAAGLILVAGTRRYATPNCFFMSHMGTGEAYGDLFEREAQVELDRKLHDRWSSLMARHTKHPKSWWKRLHDGKRREWWLDSSGMLEHGVVDEVWPPEED